MLQTFEKIVDSYAKIGNWLSIFPQRKNLIVIIYFFQVKVNKHWPFFSQIDINIFSIVEFLWFSCILLYLSHYNYANTFYIRLDGKFKNIVLLRTPLNILMIYRRFNP